jgi:Tfp pilus assembly protein PilX
MLAHPLPTTDFPQRCAQALRERGFVLPVVLVMLVVMSTVVLLMIRRGTVDERLAANVASVVTMDTGVNYALRTCERWIRRSTSGAILPPPSVAAAAATAATPPWRNPAEWTANAAVLPSDFYGPGISAARCLVEVANNELVGAGQDKFKWTYETAGNQLEVEYEFAKFRVTSEASGPGRDGGDRLARAQSEMRIRTN